MSNPVVKLISKRSGGWTVREIKCLMEFLPDETIIKTGFGILSHVIVFKLPEGFGLRTTVKKAEQTKG